MAPLRRVFVAVLVTASAVGTAPAAELPVRAAGEPGLLAAAVPQDVLIRFEDEIPERALAGVDGLRVHYRFASLPAILATASPPALRRLAARRDVAFMEADKPIEFDLDSVTSASRARDVTDPTFDETTPPLTMPDGTPIDGSGVGVAIVDTGLDGFHPDFQGETKVGGNYWVTHAGPVASPWTANTTDRSGHGTHVAGIVGGTGALSREQGGAVYEGVAPGSTIYAFDVFFGNVVSTASIALDWIIQNGADQDPPIRIVNNSWNCSRVYCREPVSGELLHIRLATELAEAGFVVTWSAGNDPGDGWRATTNLEAINPTPGIIGVASYRDENTGDRNQCLSGASAWGASSQPETWPDLIAPGWGVTSTWPFATDRAGTVGLDSRNPITNENAYKTMTGTSMAAPHTAGVAALMLQVDPTLTPAEVEYVLKQTATPLAGPPDGNGCSIPSYRADPAHPWSPANYAAGHGLIHAYDAVVLAQGFAGVPEPVPTEALPDDFVVVRPGIHGDHAFYFTGEDRLGVDYPEATAPRAIPLAPNESRTFRSEPLADDLTFDALEIHPFIGTTGEVIASFTPPRIRAIVERETPDGTRELLVEQQLALWQILPGGPTDRAMKVMLEQPVTLAAGERLVTTVAVLSPPLAGADPAEAFWVLYWEQPFASRVVLGHVVARPDPESRTGCGTRYDCAMVDEDHVYETMTCGAATYRLTWFGPPGSALVFTCAATVGTCVVAGMPGDAWGSCEAAVDVFSSVDNAYRSGSCSYRMPDGARGGTGRCIGDRVVDP